jgi:hypothetical protein
VGLAVVGAGDGLAVVGFGDGLAVVGFGVGLAVVGLGVGFRVGEGVGGNGAIVGVGETTAMDIEALAGTVAKLIEFTVIVNQFDILSKFVTVYTPPALSFAFRSD